MTADVQRLPKYLRVAAAVRGQVADGTLRPGQPAPSGAALSRATGFSTLTCRKALRTLITEGVLLPGPSRSARPRVAGGPQPSGQRDLAAAGRGLSAALAGRRRASGLTQPELAARVGVSVTTVGHAETGRLWQSRRFWEQADAVLAADGDLLRRHDAFRAAGAADDQAAAEAPLPDAGAPAGPGPGGETRPDVQTAPGGERDAGIEAGRGAEGSRGREVPRQRSTGPASPARVTIVWSDGSVTTVHPPQTSPGEPARGDASAASPAAGPPGNPGRM
jgi:hypothetical protein